MTEAEAPPRWQAFFDAHHHDLARGVEWLLVGRLMIVLGCLVLVLLLDQGIPANFAAYSLLVFAALLSAGYLLVFRYRPVQNLELFVQAQIVGDVLLESILVYTTGGVYDMGFVVLYFASILSASLLVSERAGFVIASTATVSLALVALAYAVSKDMGMTPPLVNAELVHNVDVKWNEVVTRLIQAGFGFHLVAALAALFPYRMTRVRILYDEILDSMREGLVAIDNAGRIVFVNREARRLLNWEGLKRLEGRRFTEELRRREDAKILELLTSEQDIQEEVELELRGRGVFALDVKTTVLRDGRDRVRGVIGVFADATQKRLVAEMETRLARLEGTEEMALGIAHEIRNPLASIRGAVQELVRTGDSRWSDDDRKLASIVHRESDRLDKIVGEFLAFARNRPPERHPFDVARLVEEVALLIAQREDAKPFDVKADVQGGPFVSLVDAGQLRQVLLNVGINAIEAMKKQEAPAPLPSAAGTPAASTPSGGRRREARGRLQFVVRATELPARSALPGGGSLVAARPSVEVAVDDDGPGVPVEQRTKVFMPFFTTKKAGLGLGLALVQKIVRDHGGDVRCESSASGGARFRIVLPLVEDPARPAPGTTTGRGAATGSGLNRAPATGSGANRAPSSGSPAARTPSPGYPRPTAAATEPGPAPKT